MRKHSTIFEFEEDEKKGLIAKLEEKGFSVTDGFPHRTIYAQSPPLDRLNGTGYITPYHRGLHLIVYEIENNPLKEFLKKNYEIEVISR